MFSLLRIFVELKWRYYYKYLRNIELLILDVDGVLTDGGLWVDHKGNTIKRFNVKDGLGIKLLQEIGIKIVFISGGVRGATEKRASQLGIEYYLVEIKNKFEAVEKFQKQFMIPISKTAYVGDDINDLPVLVRCGLSCTPSDGHYKVKEHVDLVLKSKGGEGVLRELADLVLEAQNRYEDIIKELI